MEFLLIFSFHFIVMGSLVMLLSGIIGFLFPKAAYFFGVILLSMVMGYIYSMVFEIPNLTIFSVLFNGTISLLAIGLVQAYYYSKRKAEKMNHKFL